MTAEKVQQERTEEAMSDLAHENTKNLSRYIDEKIAVLTKEAKRVSELLKPEKRAEHNWGWFDHNTEEETFRHIL